MCDSFLGEMPVQRMLDTFLPKSKTRRGKQPKMDFGGVPQRGTERAMYASFVSTAIVILYSSATLMVE